MQNDQVIVVCWIRNYNNTELEKTCVIKFGSMFNGNRSTANKESDVKALEGVKSPPSKVNIPNDVTVTRTGILLSMKVLHCRGNENGVKRHIFHCLNTCLAFTLTKL